MKNEVLKLRTARGYSQAELADITGLIQQKIHRIETKNSEIYVLDAIKLARGLDCKVKDLFVINDEDGNLLDGADDLIVSLSPAQILTNLREMSDVGVDKIVSILGISQKTYLNYEKNIVVNEDGTTSPLSPEMAIRICTVILMIKQFSSMTASFPKICPKITNDEKEILDTYKSLAKADKQRVVTLLKSFSAK